MNGPLTSTSRSIFTLVTRRSRDTKRYYPILYTFRILDLEIGLPVRPFELVRSTERTNRSRGPGESQRDDCWGEVVLGGVPRPRFPVAVSGAEARGRQGRFHRPVGKSLAATKGSRFPQRLPASGTYKNRG